MLVAKIVKVTLKDSVSRFNGTILSNSEGHIKATRFILYRPFRHLNGSVSREPTSAALNNQHAELKANPSCSCILKLPIVA